MKTLTPDQERILFAVYKYRINHGYSPSIRDLSEETQMAVSNLQIKLPALKESGWLDFNSNSRSFSFPRQVRDLPIHKHIPVVGEVD